MSISAIDGTCAFLCRSVGAGRYWKAEGSGPCPCGVGWVGWYQGSRPLPPARGKGEEKFLRLRPLVESVSGP